MDINNIIGDLEKCLQEGFSTQNNCEFHLFNDICGKFIEIFNYVYELIKTQNKETIELCELCVSQITKGLKNLQKTILIELKYECHLMQIRQHILASILWCLSRFRSTALLITDDDEINPILITKQNFVNDMDIALELIAPLAIYETVDKKSRNITEENIKAIDVSKNLRIVINSLMAHSLAFINITLEEDNKALKATCRKVLKECIAFQDECSVSQTKHYPQERRLRAAMLENSLYQLDKLVNDCLLRLVITVFSDLDNAPLKKLRELAEAHCPQAQLDKEIANFDIILDRLLQIGIFAIAFCDDNMLKSTLRSCLASIELLDTDLLPIIFTSQHKYESIILEQHWQKEIKLLRKSIQFIIDTKGFCTTIIDILNVGIDQLHKQYDIKFIEQLLCKCNILYENIMLNYKILNLHESTSASTVHFNDFQLMLNECQCAIKSKDITSARIMKRLKILLIKLKKFTTSLSPTNTTNDQHAEEVAGINDIAINNNENIVIENSFNTNDNDNNINSVNNNDDIKILDLAVNTQLADEDQKEVINNEMNAIDIENFFESFGIQPSSPHSILYTENMSINKSKLNYNINNNSTTIENNNSLMKEKEQLFMNVFPSTEKIKKMGSLRLQIFKKKHNDVKDVFPMKEINQEEDTEKNESEIFTDVSNILEQLTDLSTTFSKP